MIKINSPKYSYESVNDCILCRSEVTDSGYKKRLKEKTTSVPRMTRVIKSGILEASGILVLIL
jgi:hypothetical protein